MNAPFSPSVGSPDDIARFHIAEYTALMNKSVALVNLMFGVMTIGFAFLGIMVNVWPAGGDKRTNVILLQHLWGSLLPEQIIIIFWSSLLYAEDTIAIYIDKTLRPLCVNKIPDRLEVFWRYNTSLQKNHAIFRFVSSWMPAFTSISALLGILIFRFGFVGNIHLYPLEYFAILIGLALALITMRISHKFYSRR